MLMFSSLENFLTSIRPTKEDGSGRPTIPKSPTLDETTLPVQSSRLSLTPSQVKPSHSNTLYEYL